MKRRDFLATACIGGAVATSVQSLRAAEPSGKPQFLDFRMVTAPNAQRLEAMVKHNGETVIPIINKYGLSPIGLFVADTELNAKEANYNKKYDSMMYNLTPHPTLDSTQELAAKLRTDAAYREANAATAQGTTSKDPLYTAHERMLLRCFPEFPEVKVPSSSAGRIFQLRLYRSHNFDRNRAKVNQFTTENGAIETFAECGIKPVFISTTLYGSFMPSLVFMLCFESEEHKNDAWAKFIAHPYWLKLRSNPAYADTATEIINIYLKPCKGSQI